MRLGLSIRLNMGIDSLEFNEEYLKKDCSARYKLSKIRDFARDLFGIDLEQKVAISESKEKFIKKLDEQTPDTWRKEYTVNFEKKVHSFIHAYLWNYVGGVMYEKVMKQAGARDELHR
jgi:hypothetical protein